MGDILKKNMKNLVAGLIFILFALWLASVVPTIEIAWVVALLLLTIYLFAFEIVGVDVAAISIMVLLGLTSLFAPWMGLEKGLIDNQYLMLFCGRFNSYNKRQDLLHNI